jgi:type I restriction enzyme, S subunit
VSRWRNTPLGEVALVERNAVDPSDIAEGATYVGLEHIEGREGLIHPVSVTDGMLASSKFRFTEGHVLYGKLRPYLAKIACPTFAGVCSTDILPILPGPQIDRRFLFHFLRQPSMVEYASSQAVGVNLPRISPSTLAHVQIPLPPLSEQRRIAAILDQAEALRAKRRQILTGFGFLAQGVFLHEFGDPVSNSKDWPQANVGDLLRTLHYGPRFYNEEYSNDGVRIVRITDLNQEGDLAFNDMPKLRVPDEELEKHRLRPGDVIFARTGATVGKLALIEPGSPPCIAGAYFITMRFTDEVEPIYARYALSSPSIQAIITARSRQAAQQNFSGPGVRSLPMPLPPLDRQRTFAAQVSAIAGMKAIQRASLAASDELFASLQHRAFRGEL